MSALVLSFLLLVLIAIGLVMGRTVVERFANPPAATAPTAPTMSPALANLIATPALVAATSAQPPPQVDTLARDKEVVDAAAAAVTETRHPVVCPPCPKCPDMSQYIRMDEVPCWNCSLP